MKPKDDYRALTGPQKAAIMILALGDDKAKLLFERMGDDEIKEWEMTKLKKFRKQW